MERYGWDVLERDADLDLLDEGTSWLRDNDSVRDGLHPTGGSEDDSINLLLGDDDEDADGEAEAPGDDDDGPPDRDGRGGYEYADRDGDLLSRLARGGLPAGGRMRPGGGVTYGGGGLYSPGDRDPGGSDTGSEGGATHPAAQMHELLRCFVCLSRLVDAQLVPCCSKLCCAACALRWLEDHSGCPHCRAPLRPQSLIPCRFVSELASEVDRLRSSLPSPAGGASGATPPGRATDPPCSVHDGVPRAYYCSTCDAALCPDCALFGPEHAGHAFEKLSAAVDRKAAEVTTAMAPLRDRLATLKSRTAAIEANARRVTAAKAERSAELEAAAAAIDGRLGRVLQSKLGELAMTKRGLESEAALVAAALSDAGTRLATDAPTTLLSGSGDLLRALAELGRRPLAAAPPPIEATFPSELVPPYDGAELVMRGFRVRRRAIAASEAAASLAAAAAAASGCPSPSAPPALGDTPHTPSQCPGAHEAADSPPTGDVVYSAPLVSGGVRWRLKVYPNGNGIARGKYLSVFVEMVSGPPGVYDYKVQVTHPAHPGTGGAVPLAVAREFTSAFEPGECWGYNRLLKLESLGAAGYLGADDTLRLRFGVRHPSYRDMAESQSRAMAALAAELEVVRASGAALSQSLSQALVGGAGGQTETLCGVVGVPGGVGVAEAVAVSSLRPVVVGRARVMTTRRALVPSMGGGGGGGDGVMGGVGSAVGGMGGVSTTELGDAPATDAGHAPKQTAVVSVDTTSPLSPMRPPPSHRHTVAAAVAESATPETAAAFSPPQAPGGTTPARERVYLAPRSVGGSAVRPPLGGAADLSPGEVVVWGSPAGSPGRPGAPPPPQAEGGES